MISIHAPLAGSDTAGDSKPSETRDFNPRSPCGERPDSTLTNLTVSGISIHAPLAGSDVPSSMAFIASSISIHAPLAGSDNQPALSAMDHYHFNPRSPCGERRISEVDPYWRGHFNPRSPCGERLCCWHILASGLGFQSTLPLRGATVDVYRHQPSPDISIHAPLAGSDPISAISSTRSARFQSTLPLRGATCRDDLMRDPAFISIHAPLAGSDTIENSISDLQSDFNPRSPCGERPAQRGYLSISSIFQSTLPLRGATPSYILSNPV